MTKKEIIKALSRYPDNAIIGIMQLNHSLCDGDICDNFYISSKRKIAKRYVSDGSEIAYDECQAFIVV